MKFKDKEGKELSGKEFLKRWKNGINGITPLQQTKVQLQGSYIMALGIILGIIFSLFAIKTMWWIIIILIGGMFQTVMQIVSFKQKINLIKQFGDITFEEDEIKEVKKDV